jgi:O-antigen/teichoic acid export membrane protein
MLTTVITVVLNVLFLAYFQMGVTGYVLATILADAFSALSLFVLLRLHRFVRVRSFGWETAKKMLRYSVPLMPTAIFWWVINLSDRYFVAYMVGVEVNGLYTVAYKIPTMITVVSAIFTQAWQISAFDEYQSEQGERFYSNVFRSYYTFVFLAASAIILLIKPITSLLVAPEFWESWRLSPFLVLAVSFSCLVTFLGTIYNAAKKNGMVTITTLIGALTNIALNALLIPQVGANGAAIATFISFFLVFVIRAVDTRRYMALRIQPPRIAASLALLLIQSWAALSEVRYWVLIELIVMALLAICNFGYILFLLSRLYSLLPRRET